MTDNPRSAVLQGDDRAFNDDVPKRVQPLVLREEGDEYFPLVLADAVDALDHASIPHGLIGGIASSGYGRPRSTHDIDVLVKPEDADRALAVLHEAGFDIEKTDPRWLYKAFKHQVMVDVIFSSAGGIQLDDEMMARARVRDYRGHAVRLIAPEDLIVMKAVVHAEEVPRHWHDALGLIARAEIDWEYLLRRARRAPRRVLALLIYAHSEDLSVPNRVVRSLYGQIYEG